MSADELIAQLVDDIELPEELPEPDRTWIARVAHIALQRPNARTVARRTERKQPIYPILAVDWEPLNFKYDFNPAVFTDNPKNYQRDEYAVYDNDGQVLPTFSSFGKVKEGFQKLGYKITKNEVFRPVIEGKIFKVKNVIEEYTPKDPEGNPQIDPKTGKPVVIKIYITVPVEELSEYKHPGDLRVVRRGYQGGGGGIASNEPSAEAMEAAKRALHGKRPAEFTDALFDSGDPAIMGDPFIAEAANNTLEERMKRAGGQMVAGTLVFPELGG